MALLNYIPELEYLDLLKSQQRDVAKHHAILQQHHTINLDETKMCLMMLLSSAELVEMDKKNFYCVLFERCELEM